MADVLPQKWGLTEIEVAEPDRLNRVTGEYAAAAGAVAVEVGAGFVDTWTEFQKNVGWRNFLSDGLHLTPAGSAALYTLLQRTIDSQLPHLRCPPPQLMMIVSYYGAACPILVAADEC